MTKKLKDDRTKWKPPTKREKQGYMKLSKKMKYDSRYYPTKGYCPKCKIVVTKKGFSSIINRNKAEFLFSKTLARALSENYFRCKSCGQVFNYPA